MIKSLQDQLISTGLIDKKKAKKITSEQHKNNRKQRGSAAPQHTRKQSEASNANAQRDRELNRQRQAQSEQKAIAAQIRQIVHANRLPREEDGDTAFNFVVQGKVKKIHVTQETRDQISTGKLAIVEVDSQYDLVPSSLLEKLRKRNGTCVVFYNDPQKSAVPAEDDYADHQVPDDLVW